MLKTHNETVKMIKTSWPEVRSLVHPVAPKLAQLVDDLNPTTLPPLYLAHYPYGSNIPRQASDCAMLGLCLDKKIECFLELKKQHKMIPVNIYQPGDFFSFSNLIPFSSAPSSIMDDRLKLSAGCRSVFMLPHIGQTIRHHQLKKTFYIQTKPVKHPYDHFALFQALAHANYADAHWQACVLYFPKEWINRLHNDKQWQPLKCFLYERQTNNTTFLQQKFYYEFILAHSQEKTNLKSNPYFINTAKQLFEIGIGHQIGFEPCIDESALPCQLMQQIFLKYYKLQYAPTIMQPNKLTNNTKAFPVYYSLQYPTIIQTHGKSSEDNTAIFQLKHIQLAIKTFQTEFSKLQQPGLFDKLSQATTFSYYHHRDNPANHIHPIKKLIQTDARFQQAYPDLPQPLNAKFFRGCIRIT